MKENSVKERQANDRDIFAFEEAKHSDTTSNMAFSLDVIQQEEARDRRRKNTLVNQLVIDEADQTVHKKESTAAQNLTK